MADGFLTVAEVAELLKLNQRSGIWWTGAICRPCGSGRGGCASCAPIWTSFSPRAKRLTQRSNRRIAFDDALGAASKALRGKDEAAVAAALRSLSRQALALAEQIDAASGA